MSEYLLTLALGPVQEFIAAARRTRDFWFGSYMLSEISKAAAKSLADIGTLIFPAPENLTELNPDSGFLSPNKILARIPAGRDPAKLAEQARAAAQERWRQFADQARRFAGEEAIRADIWDEQIEDVIEFYAAWVPLEPGCYRECRERLECILAGRKALRDFRPAVGRAFIPKSSLDGARESVLSPRVKNDASLRLRLNIKAGEQLDAVGLIKRCAAAKHEGRDVQFISVTRVAADPWIRGRWKSKEGRDRLRRIESLCHADFVARVRAAPYTDYFPYEGDPLYQSRLRLMLQEQENQENRAALQEIGILLNQEKIQPSPYLCLLAADGDHMGRALSLLQTPEEHVEFSRRLSSFASEAGKIMEKNYGCLIYGGGDDILALLPLDTCLNAARELHDCFVQRMKSQTLSVGIAIGHCMEPLEELLAAVREAEKAAKAPTRIDGPDERDGLAVHLRARGGDAVKVRGQWCDENRLDERLTIWAGLLADGKLPDKVAYDLHALATDYLDWPDGAVPEQLLRIDAERLLKRKRNKNKELPQEMIQTLLQSVRTPGDLQRLALELVIARHLARAIIEADSVDRTSEVKNTRER